MQEIITNAQTGEVTVRDFTPEEIAAWEAANRPTRADVNAERNRRMRGTFTFNGVAYNCDEASLQRITGAGTLAGFAIAAGAQPNDLFWHGGESPFAWIAADNSVVTMDAQTCFAFARKAAENETAHIFAAFTIKEYDPIPQDYAADFRWPQV